MDFYFLTFLVQFLFFLLLNYFFQTDSLRKIIKSKRSFCRLLILVVLSHLFSIAFLRKEVGDVMLFSGAGWHLRHRIDFYWIDQLHQQYPFFPFLIFFHAFANFLTEKLSFFTFSFYFKLFLLLPSLYCLSWIIFITNKKQSLIKTRQNQLIFLSSPITYSVILFHGQFDVILLFFLFVSFHLLMLKNNPVGSLLLSAISYAASVAVKTWSLIFIPLVFKLQRNILRSYLFWLIVFIFLFGDVFIYTRLVFGSSFSTVLPAVLKAGGGIGVWGLTFIFSFWPRLLKWISANNMMYFAFLFLLTEFIILKKELSFWKTCFLIILGVYLTIPNWAVQYLFWILPFLFKIRASLGKSKVNFFLSLATIYVFLSYLNIAKKEAIIPLGLISWLGFVLWCFLSYWFYFLLSRRNHWEQKS